MNRSAMVFAMLVAGLMGSLASVAAPVDSKSAAAPTVQKATGANADAIQILEQIAAGKNAAPAIGRYRSKHGDGLSISVDRSAELRQLRDAEQALADALGALNRKAAPSGPAEQAYQSWRAALMVWDVRQEQVGVKLGANAAGRPYQARHQGVVAERRARQQRIIGMLEPMLGQRAPAPDKDGAAKAAPRVIEPGALKDALALLAPTRTAAPREPILNALALPVGGLNLAARAPLLVPALAPSYATATETPAQPADSAATPEAPLSDEVVAQATALGNDYVRIYEWVRNTHRTEWYAGSVRGAIGTLRSGAGNDVDQASLLVALLRAAGVPSHYVRGVVELDLDKIANDMGLKDSALVPSALAKAGVAFSPIVRGGKVAAVQVERMWVAALVPYTNYRGASVDASGKTWIPLDPSFKDSNWSAAKLAMSELGSAAALQTDYLSQARAESFAAFVERRATETLQRRDGDSATYAGALSRQSVAPMNLSLLPNSLPYPVLAVTSESAALAPSDIVQARLTMTSGSTTVLDLSLPLHEITNQRMTLSYQPATLEDHRLTLSFGGLDAVPLYLIQLRPQVNLGGKPRLLGSAAVTPGAELALDIVLSGPFGSQRVSQQVMAGAYQAIHIGGAGATRPAVTVKSDSESYGASLLDGVAVSYSKAWAEGDAQLAALNGVALLRPVPPVAIVTNHMDTEYVGETPYTLVWKGVNLDAATHPVEALGANAKTFLAMSGLHGSSLESVTFEQQFSVDAVSADKGLALAKAAGVALLNLTAANVDAIDAGDHLQPVKDHIRNLVRLGYRVEVPATRINHKAWNGSVWRASDEASGASGYFISGGLAGGETATAPQAWTLDFLAAALSSPNSEEANDDPLAGVSMVKLGDGDGQTGTVGKQLDRELSVAVFDKDGAPVKGARVTFSYLLGDGKVGKDGVLGSSFVAVTSKLGIASAQVQLGEKTEANPHYLKIEGSDPNVTKVSINTIEVWAEGAAPMMLRDPFVAVAVPDELTGLTRTTPETETGVAAIWSSNAVVMAHDKFDNPLPNVQVEFSITSTKVCNSSGAAQHFKQGAVFDNSLNEQGTMVGCGVSAPLLGSCGGSSFGAKSRTDGSATAGVIFSNDIKGINIVKASAGDFNQEFTFNGNSECPSSEGVLPELQVVSGTTGFISGAMGQNISASNVGTPYAKPLITTVFFREFPYEYKNGAVYFHPFSTLVRNEATVEYDIGGDGHAIDRTRIGKGQWRAKVVTGPQPMKNTVTAIIDGVFKTPIVLNGVLSFVDQRYRNPHSQGEVYGLKPTIEKVVVAGVPPEPDTSVIRMDLTGRTASTAAVHYKVLPEEYLANGLDVDIFENGNYYTTLPGSTKNGAGIGYIWRGQAFDAQKDYEAQLVLNRGSMAEVLSEKFRLPTRQKLINFARGAKAELDVDLLNKSVCDIAAGVSFSFSQDVTATLKLERVNSQGEPSGEIKTLFEDQPYGAGDATFPIGATDVGNGEFRMLLSAVSSRDGQTDEDNTQKVSVRFMTVNQMPIGHVISHGIKVRDGSLMVQTQAMELLGRGPSMRFQPSYSTAASANLGPMGVNWTHNFESSVRINKCGVVSVSGGDGGGVRFFPNDAGELVPGIGYHSTLLADKIKNEFNFYSKGGIKYRYIFGNRKAQEWILDSITDPSGNNITLEYDMKADPKPRLMKVRSSSGRTFAFAYKLLVIPEHPNGPHPVISSVAGPGITMTFDYDTFGNLIAAKRNGRTERFDYSTGAPSIIQKALMIASFDANDRRTGYNYNERDIEMEAKNGKKFKLPHNYISSLNTPSGSVGIEVDIPEFKSSAVTDQNGVRTSYTFNQYGSPLAVTNPVGTTLMSWSETDIGMKSKTDPRGITTLYEYDSAGNLTWESTGGKTILRSYLIQSAPPYMKDRLLSMTDRNGNRYGYQLNNAGQVTLATQSEGVSLTQTYASNGDMLSATDGNGGMSKFEYDAHGNQTRVTDPVGGSTSTPRNARGHVTSKTDAMGGTMALTLDAQDRVTEQVDAMGGTRKFSYDAVGNKTSDTDENNVRMEWIYGAHDLPETIKRGGDSKSIGYDGVGNKIAETDFRGNGTTYRYDGGNRVILRTEPLGKKTSYDYDGKGNLTKETDARGGETTHSYNALSYRTRTVDAENGEWLMGRDGNGNKTSSTDPMLRVTTFDYDGQNRMTVQKAPLGATTRYNYDKNNNKTRETDPNGHATEFGYDGGNRMTSVQHPDGKATLNTYDLNDNLTKTIDPNLAVTLITYDALNRKTSVKDGEGYTTSYSYDDGGNLTGETLPNQNALTHTYNDQRLRIGTRDSMGLVGAWDYDPDGNKTSETDANGNSSTHTYNDLGQLSKSVLPMARTLEFDYDPMGNRTLSKDARANSTKYTYDKLNRLTETEDARHKKSSIEYDKVGNVTVATDWRRHVTNTVYDDLNRPKSVTDALSKTVSFSYDLAGNKLSETNKRNVVTRFVYDDMNRLLSTTKDGVRLSLSTYDGNGNVLSVSDANGNVTGYTYDKRNVRVSEQRPLAAISKFVLDAMGDVTTVTDPEGRITTNGYDKRRRMTSQQNNASETTSYEYDGAGNRTVTKRPMGAATIVTYDAAQRATEIKDAAGTSIYEYDPNGNHTAFKDALLNRTRYDYDELNRRIEVGYPGGAKESFSYDANGNMTGHIDGNGITVGHVFDELNRETSKTYSASADGLTSIVTGYDANNNVLTVTENGASVRISMYGYDNFDRQESHEDGFGASAKQTYDPNGNKTALITQDGKLSRYTYDALNRLKTITSQSGNVGYSYDRSGLNTRVTFGNGVTSSKEYDNAMRVKSAVHAKGSNNLSRTTYTYDDNGNRLTETINRIAGAQVTSYRYDDADRLKQTSVVEAGKTVTTDYVLDAAANRRSETVSTTVAGATTVASKTYTYDGRNQLRTIDDATAGNMVLNYDDQGNLISKTQGNELTTYGYNARDNLIEFARNSTVLGRYGNNYLGLRVEKEAKDPLQPNAPPVRLRTLWDGRNAFQDRSTDGSVMMRYESDGRHPVSMWSRDDGVQALHHDALGSVVATTDGSGALKSETIYDAFGNVQETTGQSANKFGYTGHQMDHESGLVYFQARYYDPQIGRFITQDPFEGDWKTPLSLHHYLYAYANPTTYVDLNGYDNSFVADTWNTTKTYAGNTAYLAGAAVGAVNGYVVGTVKATIVAPYEVGKFIGDAGQAVYGTEDGKARWTQRSKDLVHGLLTLNKTIDAIPAKFDKFADDVAAERAQGNNFTAGLKVGNPVGEIIGGARAGGRGAAREAGSAISPAVTAEARPISPKPTVAEAPSGPPKATVASSAVSTAESTHAPTVRSAAASPAAEQATVVAETPAQAVRRIRVGKVDSYRNAKKETGDGSVDRDHMPSKAAILKRAADLKGEPLTPAETTRMIEEAETMNVPKVVHKEGPTHGHKNTPEQIHADSCDLAGAMCRDVDAAISNSRRVAPDSTAPIEAGGKIMKDKGRTNADYDKWIRDRLEKE